MNDEKLDRLIGTANPASVREDSRLNDAVAGTIAKFADPGPARIRLRHRRWLVAGLGVVVAGGLSAVAAPSVFDSLGWSPDASVALTYTIDGRGPISCEMKAHISAAAGSNVAPLQAFIRDHHWGGTANPIQLTTLNQPLGTTDLGVIAESFSTEVSSELDAAFPGWRTEVASVDYAGQCGGIGDDGMFQ